MQPAEKNDVFKNLFRFFRLEGAKFPQGVNIFGRRRGRTPKKHARKALPCMPGTCAAEGGEVPGAKTEPCGGGGNEMGQRRRAGCGPEAGERPGERRRGWKSEGRTRRGRGGGCGGAKAEGRSEEKGAGKARRAEKAPAHGFFTGEAAHRGRDFGKGSAGRAEGRAQAGSGERMRAPGETQGKIKGWRTTAQGGSGTRERGRGKGAEMCGPGAGPVFGKM